MNDSEYAYSTEHGHCVILEHGDRIVCFSAGILGNRTWFVKVLFPQQPVDEQIENLTIWL